MISIAILLIGNYLGFHWQKGLAIGIQVLQKMKLIINKFSLNKKIKVNKDP